MKHPIQPIQEDANGHPRFKMNPIVRKLLDDGPFNMNDIYVWAMDGKISKDDQAQFAQLIGYSLSGFSELGYVDDETYNTASRMWETGETEEQAKIKTLQGIIDKVREGVRQIAPAVFRIHPDDLDTEC